jgi:MFS family permease
MTATAFHDPYASLRIPAFRWFLLSLGLSTLAIQMQGGVVALQVYDRTNDPLALGLVGLSEAIPFIALALFGGHAADRFDRKRININTLGLLTLCAVLLAWFTQNSRTGAWSSLVWPIYAIIAVTGVARGFGRPANSALGADIVPRECYANAASWRSSIFHAGMVTGPPLGGLLYAWKGPMAGHLAVSILMAAGVFSLIPIAYQAKPREILQGSIFASLAEGINFVRATPVLLGAMSLDLFAVLFGGAVAVLPAFAKEILMVGPVGFGILRSAPAIGSVLMGFIMAHRPPLRHAGKTMLWAVAGFGICWIAFALSRSFALSLAFLFISGMLDNISVVLRSTLLQSLTPEAMMGRVSAVNQVFIGTSNEIGAFESGLAARVMGLVPSVLFGGCMTLVVVVLTAWKVPQLRRMKHFSGND